MKAIFSRYQFILIGLVLSAMLGLSLYQISRSTSLLEQPLFAQSNPTPQILAANSQENLSEAGSSVSGFSLKPMASSYTVGTGVTPLVNDETNVIVNRLGYTIGDVWKSGVKVVPYNGLVPKRCGGFSGLLGVSGLAVKPDVNYTTCPDGRPIIPASYHQTGKYTVHFNSSAWGEDTQSAGNSTAVFAHELGHCLYFIYGERMGMKDDYLQVRNELAFSTTMEINEIFADDFMICRHGVNTSWGEGSYYNKFDVAEPSRAICESLNQLYDEYFPI